MSNIKGDNKTMKDYIFWYHIPDNIIKIDKLIFKDRKNICDLLISIELDLIDTFFNSDNVKIKNNGLNGNIENEINKKTSFYVFCDRDNYCFEDPFLETFNDIESICFYLKSSKVHFNFDYLFVNFL